MRHKPDLEALDDAALINLAIAHDPAAVRIITTRHNQRLFRTAWSVLRNHADAEEVVQEAYLKAFRALETYEGASSLTTWLTRIVLNAALDRKRSINRRNQELLHQDVAMFDEYRARFAHTSGASPEASLARKELSRLLKGAIADLPDEYRTIFILREIEGASVRETAQVLGVSEAVVKTRLFRARRRLRDAMSPQLQSVLDESLSFAGADCEAMTARVLSVLGLLKQS